ncbi:MAG: hypothetical protein NT159_16490 [Proteobacteria bacterium]|nr:hypothetical protein [Pseudomonadota bacterium]
MDDKKDKDVAARRLQSIHDDGNWSDATDDEKDQYRNNPAYFQAGPQMVIHSMTRGIHIEDILTFARCDYLVVLRLPDKLELSDADRANEPMVKLTGAAEAIDERLQRGETVTREEVVNAARDSALGRIGSGYDFLFTEIKTFHSFSCSEFVYFCYKSIHRIVGLRAQVHSFLGMFARPTVTPGDIYAAAIAGGKLTIEWQNVDPVKKKPKTGDASIAAT